MSKNYPQGVTFTLRLHPEDKGPEGAFASGDNKADAALVAEIRDRMMYSEWAWCVVEVCAEFNGFKASAYLGGCSYFGTDAECERDFKACGYYDDMRQEAFENLVTTIKAEAARAEAAQQALSALKIP